MAKLLSCRSNSQSLTITVVCAPVVRWTDISSTESLIIATDSRFPQIQRVHRLRHGRISWLTTFNGWKIRWGSRESKTDKWPPKADKWVHVSINDSVASSYFPMQNPVVQGLVRFWEALVQMRLPFDAHAHSWQAACQSNRNYPAETMDTLA